MPAAILHELRVSRVRLLSNNPRKSRALTDAGIEVVERLPCEAAPTPHSLAYLRAKKEKMGHTLSLGQHDRTGYPNHSQDRFEFASIETAIRELRAGRMIVVIDDEDRENEGDLTMAAELVTPEAINFMAKHGRGLVCLAMTGERLDELDLAAMVPDNTALHGTAFTVSIDVKGHGVTTGISAHDRAQTIRAAVDAGSSPDDFARPGHVFPLRARPGGVLERRGQTEAAVDLAGLAGPVPRGRDLRDRQRRRHHGPRAGPDPVLRDARPGDGHRRGPGAIPVGIGVRTNRCGRPMPLWCVSETCRA